ncbi:MAG: DUF58 domain-containing protein [Xanthomonadales bacterium]|nr:DUF58 domain-containing protein [Xanthomonadales bacterium]
MDAVRPGLWSRLLAVAERRLPALTRLKQPEALPLVLNRHRIYVLPTLHGVAFGSLLVVLGVGALNYDNNPALILGLMLASTAHTGLLMGFLGLRGLRLRDVDAQPVHAGEVLTMRFHFDAVESRRRAGLCLRRDGAVRHFDLPAEAGRMVEVPVPTRERGWLRAGRVSLSMRRPFGMFVVWSWLHPDRRVIVYPRPERSAPPLPLRGDVGAPRRTRGPDESFHGLRDYRSGDALRTIAWKRSAQSGQLQVKEFETPRGQEVVLRWAELDGLAVEPRISRLTSWLLEAEHRGMRSTLVMPDAVLGPARGDAHLHACLSRLALHGREDAAHEA